jgi:hypothetical protein
MPDGPSYPPRADGGDVPAPGEYQLPEVTRALRAFGARRGRPGSDHDRFYAPLLDPLRRARDHVARGTDRPWEAAALVDAGAVDAAVRAALAALAAEHGGAQPADRRALAAELEELAGPLFGALGALGGAAGALAAAAPPERAAAWRAWAAALGRAFAAADATWEAMLPALADPRGGAGRLGRRVLRAPPPGLTPRRLGPRGGPDGPAGGGR